MCFPAGVMSRLECLLLLAFTCEVVSWQLHRPVGDNLQRNYKEMITANECLKVDRSFEEELVNKVNLRYYYGQEHGSAVSAALEDAARLLNHARWGRGRPIALFFFGFNSDVDAVSTRAVVRAYLKRKDKYNLVVVDWEAVTSQSYALAVAVTEAVGRAVAKALDAMEAAGAAVAHVLGHSLGAQAAGAVARHSRHRVPFVVGLDPAGPLFYREALPGQRCAPALGPEDGDCVLALHTCMGVLGAPVPTGHLDFFPHGGEAPQPGCGHWDIPTGVGMLACSHERAVELWAEALTNRSALVGRRCSSWQDFERAHCDHQPTAQLARCGNLTGEFFLETNGALPFGKGLGGARAR